MTTTSGSPATDTGPRHRNEIRLVGSLSTPPAERAFAGGREAVTFRLDVRRSAEDGGGRDSFDCTVRSARVRRAALGWAVGDVVEVVGSAQRRFARSGGSLRPFVVVEAAQARRLAPAVTRRRKPG